LNCEREGRTEISSLRPIVYTRSAVPQPTQTALLDSKIKRQSSMLGNRKPGVQGKD